MKLGIVRCSNEEYHAGKGVSKSHLDVMAKSPLHYWQAYVNPLREPREATPAMVLGTAIHSAILEPDLFASEYVVVPDEAPRKPTSRQVEAKRPSADTVYAIEWWIEWEAQQAGRTVLSRAQYEACLGAQASVAKHAKAKVLLAKGRAETSYFALDAEIGELVKCRTDWENPEAGMIVDVKSTEDASPEAFMRSVMSFRYHVQVPWYRDVIEAATDADPLPHWTFLAIEKTPPYALGLYSLPEEVVEAARVIARENFRRIITCRALDTWWDYGQAGVQELQLPPWAARQIELNSPEQDFA